MEEVQLSSGSAAQHQPGRAPTELTRETLAAGAHHHEHNWSEAVLRTAQEEGSPVVNALWAYLPRSVSLIPPTVFCALPSA